MSLFIALISGTLFGLGLIGGGMTDPAKVQGFLDLFGAWDPSLAFVMGGAVAVSAVGFGVARRRSRPPAYLGAAQAGIRPWSGPARSWSGDPMDIPTSQRIDGRLVVGGLLFGAGWGIAGLCPGPAVTALGAGFMPAAWFVAAMLAGMWLHDRFIAGSAASPGKAAAKT